MTVDRNELVARFLSDQNPDGSWSLAPGDPGEISTSVEAYFVMKFLGVEPDTPIMRKAQDSLSLLVVSPKCGSSRAST